MAQIPPLLGPRDFEYPPIRYDARVAYGPDRWQYADLRLPDGNGPFPVAVVIHGGCWMGLHRSRHIEKMARELTEWGWATWSLAHRQATDIGGGWPGTFKDISIGIDALRGAARDHPLHLETVVTVGHSAGGHLALWAAARHKIPTESVLFSRDPLPVAGVISLAGITDLIEHDQVENRSCGDGVLKLLGGGPSQFPDRYEHASPASLVPIGVPQLLINGAHDRIVRVELATRYAAKARAAGDEISLAVIPDAGHYEVIAPDSDSWKNSIERLLSDWLSALKKRSG